MLATDANRVWKILEISGEELEEVTCVVGHKAILKEKLWREAVGELVAAAVLQERKAKGPDIQEVQDGAETK